MEKSNRYLEATKIWQRLFMRIYEFLIQSNGYVAECHFHHANIYRQLDNLKESIAELLKAVKYMREYEASEELDGPCFSTKGIKKAINRALSLL